MNRRNFLKSTGVVCGLAIVSPLKLLSKKKPDIQYGIDYWVDLHKNKRGNRITIPTTTFVYQGNIIRYVPLLP